MEHSSTMNINIPYINRLSTAILAFILVASIIYFETTRPDEPKVELNYLTQTEIDARINLLEETLDEKIRTLVLIPTQLEYDYITTIVSINVSAGENIYESFDTSQPGPDWRLREWISIEQAQAYVTFAILWEKESVR